MTISVDPGYVIVEAPEYEWRIVGTVYETHDSALAALRLLDERPQRYLILPATVVWTGQR